MTEAKRNSGLFFFYDGMNFDEDRQMFINGVSHSSRWAENVPFLHYEWQCGSRTETGGFGSKAFTRFFELLNYDVWVSVCKESNSGWLGGEQVHRDGNHGQGPLANLVFGDPRLYVRTHTWKIQTFAHRAQKRPLLGI